MEMSATKFVSQTWSHKADVRRLMVVLTSLLSERVIHHDDSKFELIDDYVLMLNGFDFRGVRKGPYQRHAEAERHHPTKVFHPETDLLDILELVCDWCSASAQRNTLLDPKTVNIAEVVNLNWDTIMRNTFKLVCEAYDKPAKTTGRQLVTAQSLKDPAIYKMAIMSIAATLQCDPSTVHIESAGRSVVMSFGDHDYLSVLVKLDGELDLIEMRMKDPFDLLEGWKILG